MTKKIQYVCGFMFNEEKTRVALIEKKRPNYQLGRLNGIGGKVEDGESPKDAMIREFDEEADLHVTDWQHFLNINGENWQVAYYYNWCSNKVFEDEILAKTDEEISKVDVNDVLSGALFQIANLPWLVECALYLINNPQEYITNV